MKHDRAKWVLVFAATATMVVSYIDRQALAVLAPTITRDLGISDKQFGMLLSAFSAAYLVGAPLAGMFIDSVGARLGLMVSMLVWSAIAGAHALVPGFGALLLLRVLLGAAEAPSFPAAAQTVSRALPPSERSAGFGLLFTGSSIGAMVAPLLVARLAASFGWRWAMLTTAVVGLLWLPAWLLITGTKSARARMEIPVERRRMGPRDLLLFDAPVVRAVMVVMATSPVGTFVLNWTSKLLVAAHHVTQRDVGHYLWLPPLMMDVGAVGFGALAVARERWSGRDRSPRELLAIGGLCGLALATLPLAHTPWQSTALCAVGLAGVGACFALVTAEMLRRVAPSRVAQAGGMTAAAQSLAYIVANPLIGWSVDRTGNHLAAAVACGLWVVPGCLVWLAWPEASAEIPQRSLDPQADEK